MKMSSKAALWVSVAGVSSTLLMAQTRERTVLDGVYTAEQAQQGKALFTRYCADCHSADLSGAGAGGNGNAPALKGARFLTDFEADNVARLFGHMRGRMPQTNPGSLRESEYIDILSYVLEANEYPAGKDRLTPDPALLRSIRIVRKGAPAEAPNFSLVRIVGCLEGAPDNWVVSKASNPVITKESAASTGDDIADAAARPLGPGSFKLLNVFDPLETHKGHKMEVKGLLVRLPAENRINVTSIQAVANSCEN